MKCYKSDPKSAKKISEVKIGLYSNPIWKHETEAKKIETCLKRYKVANPMQNPIIFKRQQKSCFKNAQIINGMRMIGFEPKAFNYLSSIYGEIELGSDYLERNQLKIIWIDQTGKQHVSFPDFYIKDENAFVEIKGTYTRKLHHYKIMEAKEAINKMGFNYFIMTIKNNKVILVEPYIID